MSFRCCGVKAKTTEILCHPGTALRGGLSKYLTAHDTHLSPTTSKHTRTSSSHGGLLSLQYLSTILFLVSSIKVTHPKIINNSDLGTTKLLFFLSSGQTQLHSLLNFLIIVLGSQLFGQASDEGCVLSHDSFE